MVSYRENVMRGDNKLEYIKVLGIKVSLCTKQQLLSFISGSIWNEEKAVVLSGNVHSMNLAYKNRWLKDLFNNSDVVRLDGIGVRLGAKILGYSTPKRMTWADFAWDLAKLAEDNRFSIFLLGGQEGVAAQAAEKLLIKHPFVKIIGNHHGYFNKNKDNPETLDVLDQINNKKPNILIIGFGMPVQEKWLMENRDKINANVILTGGAVFDYISGNLKRSPQWMNDHGLEWLGRMLIEPRRLWKRYIIGNPVFLWRVLMQRFGILKFDDN